ncbi:hypothetical protein DSO57_1036337 [Entomophthora muscae]|uniref:Uncharacterized protein n=1 Tax=Entomophthora muscae TaxID=34485 RepID=A0ACC2S183_9FUNG|nr:hypothetical protein DSO57_1036337 [Entomophthora muscae]
MKGSSTALEAIQERGHQASVYPAGHTEIHLADVVFFNIRDTQWERLSQAFNNLYLGVLDHNFLFGRQMVAVRNCAINAILIWPSNIDSCKDLTGFAFEFGNSFPSANGSGPIFTHSRLSYLSVVDPGMTLSQRDTLCHSVFLMSDHRPLSTI